jgi:hypothetical protein
VAIRAILALVFRVGAALVLAVFLLQAAGIAFAAPVPCTEECEDDGPDGQCGPNCQDCLCCAHPRAVSPVSASAVRQTATRLIRTPVAERSPPQAELEDILRVPKLAWLLAAAC